jgi:hypothetical protein
MATANDMYKKHGTTLKGLLFENIINQDGVEDFLHDVYQIDYDDIVADPELKHVIESIQLPAWVFTAAASAHAELCLNQLGIDTKVFQGIIDTYLCNFESKHSPSAFQTAMQLAGMSGQL